MKYLIDAEYRERPAKSSFSAALPFASLLRVELSQRNIRWALDHEYCHEISLGRVPAVLYREDESGRHGNFRRDIPFN